MVKIAVAPFELFIESCIVFVDFCLGVTTTPLVIAFTTSQTVEFSPKCYLVTLVSTTSAVFIFTIVLVLCNWVCIWAISVWICFIFCISWGNICVDWLVSFAVWIGVSSLSLYVGCKTLEISSTSCPTIFYDWKPASATVLSETRWKINIVNPFLPGENITTPTVSKGNIFTPRGITSHYP